MRWVEKKKRVVWEEGGDCELEKYMLWREDQRGGKEKLEHREL